MSEFARQWPEQDAGPDKRRYGPAKILEWAGPQLTVVIRLPWEVEEDFSRRAMRSPLPVFGIALIDTGATSSGFDRRLIRHLSLQPTGTEKTSTAVTGRRSTTETYSVRFSFPKTGLPDFVVAEAQPHRLSASPFFIPEGMAGKVIGVLGRDFLSFYTFTYDGPSGRFVLATSAGVAPGPSTGGP